MSRTRRFQLASVSLVFAAVLLRPLVADALCLRGDEFLRSGDPLVAQHYYRLALLSDRECGTAVERFAFVALEVHTHAILAESIRVTDAYLARHEDEAIRVDRALALWSTGDLGRAALELRAVGSSMRDQRFIRLAAIAARRAKSQR
jgi:hypothetical protein